MSFFTKSIFALFLFATVFFNVSAQDNMGIGTLTPDPTAILDITSNDKGILIPRLTTAQRVGILNPATSLLVW